MTDRDALSGTRVLVVEDNYILAMDICEWLQGAGAQVLGPAPGLEQAFELLDEKEIDSAVVDINLGQGPTFRIAERLTRDGVPFVFATGYDRSAIPAEFAGTPRVEKPFKGDNLIAALLGLESSSPRIDVPRPA